MTDRVPGAPGQYQGQLSTQELQKLQAGEAFTITLKRDDQPITEGTPYSKAAVLPDELAAQLCPNMEDPTPADALWALHERIYPVGAIYLSVLDTDPGQLFGGTWERLKDRFLLGAGDTYEAGATGGEATHTLTVEEMPSHSHRIETWYNKQQGVNDSVLHGVADYNLKDWYSTYYGEYTGVQGGTQPHNNMPPYLAVYMWKRVA